MRCNWSIFFFSRVGSKHIQMHCMSFKMCLKSFFGKNWQPHWVIKNGPADYLATSNITVLFQSFFFFPLFFSVSSDLTNTWVDSILTFTIPCVCICVFLGGACPSVCFLPCRIKAIQLWLLPNHPLPHHHNFTPAPVNCHTLCVWACVCVCML